MPHMWLPKTTSGKIARQAAKQRYLDTLHPATQKASAGPPAPPEPLALPAFVACCLALAGVLWLALALAPNPSWGVYAGF